MSTNTDILHSKIKTTLLKCFYFYRRLHAVEHGYEAKIYAMPIESSPKNDIIVGWPVRSGRVVTVEESEIYVAGVVVAVGGEQGGNKRSEHSDIEEDLFVDFDANL